MKVGKDIVTVAFCIICFLFVVVFLWRTCCGGQLYFQGVAVMKTWDAKAGDLVVLPEYRDDPGLVVLNKMCNDLERPLLVKYLDGEIIEPRYFDEIELKARNVRVKPFRAYVEDHWRKLFAGLNGMFGVWL